MHYTKLVFLDNTLYIDGKSCNEEIILWPIQDAVVYYKDMSEYNTGYEYSEFKLFPSNNVFNVTCFAECKQYNDRSYNICKGENMTSALALKIYALSAGFGADNDTDSFLNTNTTYMSDKDIADWNSAYRIKSLFDFTKHNKKSSITSNTTLRSSSLKKYSNIFIIITSLFF